MEISVIIPTYNREHWLVKAIESVINQKYSPKEIIVIDDGSTDQTSVTIKQMFPDVQLIQQQNKGVSAARNIGIQQAKGDWIALLDSDDQWHPAKLERQVQAIRLNPDYKITHTDEIWIRNGTRVNPMKKHQKPDGWIFSHCLPLCCVSPSSILIARDIFDEVGLFDEMLPVCEDYDLWLRIFCRYPIHLVKDKLVIKQGGHEDQLSKKYWGMDRFRVSALSNLLDKELLSEQQRIEVVSMLKKKLEILIAGFTKRNKLKESQEYSAMLEKYTLC